MNRLLGNIMLILIGLSLPIASAAQLPPEPAGTLPVARTMIVIGMDASHTPTARGTVTMVARTPDASAVKSVKYLVDGSEVGHATTRPFRLSWNSASKDDGRYTVKAVAMGDDGQEVWSGESQIEVANKSDSQQPSPPPAWMSPPPGGGPPLSPGLPEGVNPEAMIPPTPGSLPPVFPGAADNDGWKTYSSQKYRFTVQHPATAVAEDNSAQMTPKKAGAFWIAFAQQADQQPEYVINVRYNKLNGPSSPDDYAKYNEYLLDWGRATINGMSGFATMSGNQAAKTIIHRTLLVDGDSVWMLNLTDVTGNDSQITKAIFDRFVRSLRPGHVEPQSLPEPRQPKVAPAPPLLPPAPQPQPEPQPETQPEPQPQPEMPPAAEPPHSHEEHEGDHPASEPAPEPAPAPDEQPVSPPAPDNNVEHHSEHDADTEPEPVPMP